MKSITGFSGSRSLGNHTEMVKELVSEVRAAGHEIAVGCAPGLDAVVREACPAAMVFRVEGSSRGAFAQRSSACVEAVSAAWISFPGRGCPPSVIPSKSPSMCFCGAGSGSWASAAYAAGRGLPVIVFGLERGNLPVSWGEWRRAADHGIWSQGFRLHPRTVQLSLF